MKRGLPVLRLLAAATAIAGGCVAAGLLAGPASAAALPDLKVTVEVTPAKSAYAVGDAITTTFVITNVGDATAKNVKDAGGDESGVTRSAYLGDSFTPFDLAPGESHSVGWNGVVNEGGFKLGHASGAWEFGNDAGEADPADNIGRFRISVPGGLGTLTAKVFVDNKGTYDGDQPGLPGAGVFVTDPDGTPVATGKTNATGWVTFTGLAPQDYRVGVTGWTLRGDDPVSVLTQVMAKETATDYLALLPGSGPSPSGSASASASASATASASSTASPSPATPVSGGTTSPSPSATAGTTLPVTGSSSAPLFGIGALVLTAGATALVAVRQRRRRFVAE
jgi:LPXTG-motif cell wall-anchored protein